MARERGRLLTQAEKEAFCQVVARAIKPDGKAAIYDLPIHQHSTATRLMEMIVLQLSPLLDEAGFMPQDRRTAVSGLLSGGMARWQSPNSAELMREAQATLATYYTEEETEPKHNAAYSLYALLGELHKRRSGLSTGQKAYLTALRTIAKQEQII